MALILSCNQHKNIKKIIVKEVHITDTVDVVDPPPPRLAQTFKDVQQWLTAICGSEKPKKPVSYYETGLFESEKSRVLFLVGMSKSPNSKRIVFEPRNRYYSIPLGEFKDLSREQLDDKLIDQIKGFTKTKIFSDSYLAQSNSILYQEKTIIWSKP